MKLPTINWQLLFILIFFALFLIWLARPNTDIGQLIFLPRRPGI